MQSNLLTAQVKLFWQTAKKYWGLALAPLVLLTAVALVFALTRKPTWKAAQGLIVRDQTGENSTHGRFESLDAMKTAQETILEITRNPLLVKRALKSIGAPADREQQGAWPSEDEVGAALDGIAVSAPKGAEFGSTEMIYLNVSAGHKARAVKLNQAVCDELEKRLQEIREERANSIIAELQKSLALSQTELEKSTGKLESMEREVGRDLGELRMLNTQGSGESNLRSGISQIKNELRRNEALLEEQQQQLTFLRSAVDDPTLLLGAPSRLLATQPALRRLKDGLVDAQLRTAQLSGTRSPDHPLMKAARIGEQEVRRDLHRELHSAISGLTAAIEVTSKQQQLLKVQLADVTGRMNRLAGLRARYGNLVADVRQRTAIVAENNRSIADAKARQEAAQATSLLTRIDSPVTGNKPEGPGKTTIVAAGVAGGLFAGFGLLLLVTPIGSPTGQSWSPSFLGRRQEDQQGRGRRGSDNAPGQRRASDAPSSQRRASDTATRRASDQPGARRASDQPAARRASDQPGERRASDATSQTNEPSQQRPVNPPATPQPANENTSPASEPSTQQTESSQQRAPGNASLEANRQPNVDQRIQGDRRGGDRRQGPRRG